MAVTGRWAQLCAVQSISKWQEGHHPLPYLEGSLEPGFLSRWGVRYAAERTQGQTKDETRDSSSQKAVS